AESGDEMARELALLEARRDQRQRLGLDELAHHTLDHLLLGRVLPGKVIQRRAAGHAMFESLPSPRARTISHTADGQWLTIARRWVRRRGDEGCTVLRRA